MGSSQGKTGTLSGPALLLAEPPHRQAQEIEDKQVSAEAIFPRQAS